LNSDFLFQPVFNPHIQKAYFMIPGNCGGYILETQRLSKNISSPT
jgi:hypothetical protein